ncbi:uncharacterized protein EI97DRAFT_456399 [Westerdykella ornata]|uniref:Uncharacterized protein n=1 Tax=Westerdykella ornata TaxID=318751 RepID=A0A6A6JRU5_WESOR|nr:uncharacterized protein EI97DRAFT_456399 [Westerdykella ornata]KAF2278985.1 hypothetical protein EI97DRAFT_456399 [Westerdykella ornata]
MEQTTPEQLSLYNGFKLLNLVREVGDYKLQVQICIPDDVYTGDYDGEGPVHVRFGNGGLATDDSGEPLAPQWRHIHIRDLAQATHSITIRPNIPLPIYCSGQEMLRTLDNFMEMVPKPTFSRSTHGGMPQNKGHNCLQQDFMLGS